MSDATAKPTETASAGAVTTPANGKPVSKATSQSGKGKGKAVDENAMDEDVEEGDEEEDDDEDDEEEEEEELEIEEDDLAEIDPKAILPTGRSRRGPPVDYTSEEALKKAGIDKKELEEDEGEDSFHAPNKD